MGTGSALIDGPDDLDVAALAPHGIVGLTAGASAPEHLVQAVVAVLVDAGYVAEEVDTLKEDVKFLLPRELRTDKP
jgi:4-hydroxy-3-methylbut-2-enyl diphosphate reductase